MFNGLVLVKVDQFTGTSAKPATADKNGAMPVILLPIAGTIPNRMVLSGTIAERAKFIPGGLYLAQVTEKASDSFGRKFSFMNLGQETNLLNIVQHKLSLGQPVVFDAALADADAELQGAEEPAGAEAEKDEHTF